MKYIGIDNGCTGSIAVINDDGSLVFHMNTPVTRCANYTKTVAYLHRIDVPLLIETLKEHSQSSHCWIERPMVNPGRFKATVSALRCLEATEIVLEILKVPYTFVDSKEWQRSMLPKGIDKDGLKFASDQVCKRLFPSIKLSESGRGDSLLIAEYFRRSNLGNSNVVEKGN